jgi:hypothetical protein
MIIALKIGLGEKEKNEKIHLGVRISAAWQISRLACVEPYP